MEFIRLTKQALDHGTPTPTQAQRRRQAETPDEDEDMEESPNGGNNMEQLSKSLVRYALSCELARKPIKRQDMNEKGVHLVVFKD